MDWIIKTWIWENGLKNRSGDSSWLRELEKRTSGTNIKINPIVMHLGFANEWRRCWETRSGVNKYSEIDLGVIMQNDLKVDMRIWYSFKLVKKRYHLDVRKTRSISLAEFASSGTGWRMELALQTVQIEGLFSRWGLIITWGTWEVFIGLQAYPCLIKHIHERPEGSKEEHLPPPSGFCHK